VDTYRVTVAGNLRMRFGGDFANAASPLVLLDLDGDDTGPSSTPLQVADARHSPYRAAERLNAWLHSEGGGAWGEDEDYTVETE